MLIKVDRFLPAFTKLDDVVEKTNRTLACGLVCALIAWILFAALLYFIEDHVTRMHGSFDNMPLSLFFTMILMGGEWCRVDLETPYGEIVGVCLAIIGVSLAETFVGSFFEAFQNLEKEETIEEDDTPEMVQVDTVTVDAGDEAPAEEEKSADTEEEKSAEAEKPSEAEEETKDLEAGTEPKVDEASNEASTAEAEVAAEEPPTNEEAKTQSEQSEEGSEAKEVSEAKGDSPAP